MVKAGLKRSLLIGFLWAIAAGNVKAQIQDDFTAKLQEVYKNTEDSTKAMKIAKDLYKMVEHSKDLQTYSNYYLLKQVFENVALDKESAKSCQDALDKLIAATNAINAPSWNDSSSKWYQDYYPALFATTDPGNARKASQFLDRNPSLKNFNNYNYLAYAYERNGDFQQAKENYEHAIALKGNDKEEYHSYSYYTGFLSRMGEYLKAEEYIQKMEKLSKEAIEAFQFGYKSEAISSKVVYDLAIGDYQSYAEAAGLQYDYLSQGYADKTGCDPYPGIRDYTTAYAKEMMKDYNAAERLWKSRDSADYLWLACSNKKYPAYIQYPLSEFPVYLIKRGKRAMMPQPAAYYIKETETYYNNFSQYADISTNFMKAIRLAFLGSPQYPVLFKPILEQIRNSRDYRESTQPFSQYAYFSMRDRRLEESKEIYRELFNLNAAWINDIIFSFGEKAFVTYYNSRLREGYENYHSLVKIAKEKQPSLFPELAIQAYNNLLFTKSISLQGTEKRKQAFLKTNDPNTNKLYQQWIDKKQQLIRQYFKSEDPAGADTVNKFNTQQVKALQEEVNHLENELAVKAKDFKKYFSLNPPDWKSVRDQLKEGEAAIEMIRFQWRDQVYYSDTSVYAAYIITKNSPYPEVVYLPDPAADLDDKYYKQYRNNIRLKLDDKDSYNHYWKPISEQLRGIRKIYFSPDGIFHLINLSTLKNPATGQFLLDEMEIHYTVSGTDIRNETGMNKEIRTAVLVGRPLYKLNDAEEKASPAPVDDNTRSLIRNFKDNDIPDLPGTEEEVLAIKKEMDQGRINVTTYLKEQATEDKMYKLHSPDILHIATHGYWSGAGENATEGYRVFNAMVNSGLLLSGVINYYRSPEYPDTYDGILTAYEAQNLNLENTSLVVLSACETSLGYLDAGEGVYGLQRAFRAAGAKNIMTSLWKVDDQATKDFMIFFYQHYLNTKDRAFAFIMAQKAIKEKYHDPYYWGAFVMVGE